MRLPAAACAALVLAAGCATVPGTGAAPDWPARRAELQALEDWSLSGRVAVAFGEEGVSGGMSWRQRGDTAEFEVRGPMGTTLLSARVAGADYTITDRRGLIWSGDDEVLAVQRGDSIARLPVRQLRYWLLGVPAPGEPMQESAGGDGRLETLEQSGWQLRYPRYREAGRDVLPARIEMESQGIRLRVVVSSWRLGS